MSSAVKGNLALSLGAAMAVISGIFGCTPRVPAEYVKGADVCSMTPQLTRCKCDGEWVMATSEDNASLFCEKIISFCRGRVYDCRLVSNTKPLEGLFAPAAK
jgi:hypothetical protein